jgi:GT2 family glycosyltransferase
MNDKRLIFFEELYCQTQYNNQNKDIIIIIKDQIDYVKKCIDSIYQNTSDFNIYIWDNASKPETANYLKEISSRENVHLTRSEENLGFIVPNNRLAAISKSPFLILLNSDTEVRSGWDSGLIGYLLVHDKVALTGYHGCVVDAEGRGHPAWCGDNIDFIPGWCACLKRETYERFGLFDESNLDFAYCEDSDLSFRLQEAGRTIYALHLDLVIHHGNKTITQVQHERDVTATFKKNHHYIQKRWDKYLREQRVLLKNPSMGGNA